ncbi:hypothetical protein LIER_36710 [Lithospermum erythrorhizon]|uniref:Reverse transcriptase domain-containing protein n=1 Tax=Lithospermum erythrorhizon TaxID=34254 RepID=A0AAV3PCF8_LITER
MPFGLKNGGATFLQMVNTIFAPHIGHNVEIYVDDMLVKRKDRIEHLDNLKEKFIRLRERRLKLNPFVVTSGKFLGYMIRKRGIEPNLDKIKALLEMKSPNSYKDGQTLIGCLAASSRFVSKAAKEISLSSRI